MINQTLAAILTKQKTPLTLVTIQLPEKLDFGQVLVKIHYSCICGAQLNEIEGAKGPDKFLPHLLGHEGVATVLETGPGVKNIHIGDLVVMHWRPSLGIQAEPAEYRHGREVVHAGWVTTFQKYAVVSENRLTPIPKTFNKKIASLFGCAVTTAVGVINNDAQVKIGQSVVVFGVGGVGLQIIQAARMVSAYPIVGIDLIPMKFILAKKFGASHTIKTSEIIGSDVRKIVGDKGADVVIDTTGNTKVIELAYDLTHPDGKTILVGVPKIGNKASIYTLPLHFKKILKGSHGGSSEPHIDIPRLIKLFNAGLFKLDGVITHEYPLKKVNEAIRMTRSGKAGRVLLSME